MVDVRRTLTPQLRVDCGDSRLVLVDLGGGRNRLGGSCLAQVYGCVGREPPDCDDAQRVRDFFTAIARLREVEHVYLPPDGRINVAGVSEDNVERVADCIVRVLDPR